VGVNENRNPFYHEAHEEHEEHEEHEGLSNIYGWT